MFLKFWIISTIICVILFFSSYFTLMRDLKKEFTIEEIKNYYKEHKGNYAWYATAFLFVCPILNVLFILCFGFNYGEIKEKQFRDIRLFAEKATIEDKVSKVAEEIFKN